MNKFIITFDKSQEDIPTLVIMSEGWGIMGTSNKVENVITGDRAIELWNELRGIKEQSE